jgi:predicted aldo/keto reductase-like oxidoreductase
MKTNRRDFLKRTAGAGAAMAFTAGVARGKESAMGGKSVTDGELPRRPFGSEGDALSVVGFGAIMLGKMEAAQQEDANALVAETVAAGVNYFDVAPTYGNAEERLGPALEPYRDQVFLACKTTRRGAEGARAEFEQSLKRLRTDRIDLYQLHAISNPKEDVEDVFADGGAMEFFKQAKADGRIRHIGFSAHTEQAALDAMDRYDFDSCMFPISIPTWYQGNFGPPVVEKAREKGVTLISLKAMARERWPKDHPERSEYPNCWYLPMTDPDEAELGLRWALTQPVVAAIPPGHAGLFRDAITYAKRFEPLTGEQELARAKKIADVETPIFKA